MSEVSKLNINVSEEIAQSLNISEKDETQLTEKNIENLQLNQDWIENVIKFPYKLDTFQEKAVKYVSNNEHVMVTAHTSAGKSTIAEFSINHCLLKGKRLIYTSPIKALSNQKYADFRKKAMTGMFCCEPEDIGIITGDVQNNPDGKIIIATTEIIYNYLYTNAGFFDDVGAIVFDEVHYINDPERGKVWEGSIIMMPSHITMILLSATVPNAESLTSWISSIKNCPVGLVGTNYRPVPLEHFVYWDNELHSIYKDSERKQYETYQGILYKVKNNSELRYNGKGRGRGRGRGGRGRIQDYGRGNSVEKNKLNVKKNKDEKFQSEYYILNQSIKYLHEQEKLPGFFFCFSRKLCHRYAHSIQSSLLTSKESSIAVKRYQLLLHRYVDKHNHSVSQFVDMERYLSKGVAVHHSGLVPILKEIVEILFSEGHIKVLFVTETFAVGINLATRCVVLTDLYKYDGTENRLLQSGEYQQISGRAGRRGLDETGTVILLPLKSSIPSTDKMFSIINGPKKEISSKFELDGHFIIKAIDSPYQTISNMVNSTFLANELKSYIASLINQINSIEKSINDYHKQINDSNTKEEYLKYKNLIDKLKTIAKPKNRNICKRELDTHILNYTKADIREWENIYQMENVLQEHIATKMKYISEKNVLEQSAYQVTVDTLKFLEDTKYIQLSDNELNSSEKHLTTLDSLNKNNLSIKGQCCSLFHECPPFLTSTIVCETELFDELSGEEIICILASMIPERTNEDDEFKLNEEIINSEMINIIRKIYELNDDLSKKHAYNNMYYRGKIVPYMAEYAFLWINEKTIQETMVQSSGKLDEGNFIKSMLKLYNMVEELKSVYSLLHHPNEAKFVNLSSSILRDAVRVDSIYFTS